MYGEIPGDGTEEFYPDGTLMSITACCECRLSTPFGVFVPAYGSGDWRRKYRRSCGFYADGKLREIYLNSQTPVDTGYGMIPAELVTFYEEGGLKRIFPLYGKISAFWSEDDEFGLARDIVVEISGRAYAMKPEEIHFYPGGRIKDITLWREGPVFIDTRYGRIRTSVGFELYENGALKGIEPDFRTVIRIEGKEVHPFCPARFGAMHAENCSLQFDHDGSITDECLIRLGINGSHS